MLELQRVGDELRTDMPALQAALSRRGPENVAAVVTTSSCFAPRYMGWPKLSHALVELVSVDTLCYAVFVVSWG